MGPQVRSGLGCYCLNVIASVVGTETKHQGMILAVAVNDLKIREEQMV